MEPKALERFHESYIPVPESGCWLWLKAINYKGYGWFKYARKLNQAHRFSYDSLVGPIPDGSLVLHKCDVTCCVNPKHLWLGTPKDNSQDMVRKGRWRGRWNVRSPRKTSWP